MAAAIAQSPAIEWLRQGGPWGQSPEIVETHAALVFLIGERAYKLKKAVDLGYLDFSTVERRRDALERELHLNRRTAPNLYLRTLPITRSHDGRLHLGGDGEIADWLLEMRRFASDALLSDRAERGQLNDALVEELAAHVAQFHERAEGIANYSWPAAVARISEENERDLRSQAPANFSLADVEEASAARDRLSDACASVLDRQSRDVRHCHGDMHLGNVFLDDGRPTLFDCIEFDEFYATIPPLYDVAFLLMDLLARGRPRLANRASNAWLIHRRVESWPDTVQSLKALPLYLILRAEIRAKTEARKPGGAETARHYLDLARRLGKVQPPRLVAIGGFSGTGKSSVAKEFAWQIGNAPGALHLRTDEIRKRLAGVALDQRLPASAYTQETAAATYAKLAELARLALSSGASVVVDAVFAREDERHAMSALAKSLSVPFTGIWLEAPREVLEKRLSQRHGDASDADIAVLHRQLAYDLGHIAWHHIDATGDAASVVRSVMHHLGV
jgi:aminoglycoside phosphotransferase family enzyme/predicted kinase